MTSRCPCICRHMLSRISSCLRVQRCQRWSTVARLKYSTDESVHQGPSESKCVLKARHEGTDVTSTSAVLKDGSICNGPREARTDLLNFLNQSDICKRKNNTDIPSFTPGSYLTVTRSDKYSPSGISKFTGICIARRRRGLGSTFILRNVIDGVGVEMMYELFSPAIKEIKVLKLERRRRAKLYYLRDKPIKYSTVNERMVPVDTDGRVPVYRRKGAPA